MPTDAQETDETQDDESEYGPRGLVTETERQILLGEKDATEKYYGVVVTRVRNRIQKLEAKELAAIEAHDTLADELRDAVCTDE